MFIVLIKMGGALDPRLDHPTRYMTGGQHHAHL
ncbi:hypothetical protein LZ22198_MCBDPFMK_00951 [Levilactobacillus zymae]